MLETQFGIETFHLGELVIQPSPPIVSSFLSMKKREWLSNRVKVTVIKTQFGENTANLYFQLNTPSRTSRGFAWMDHSSACFKGWHVAMVALIRSGRKNMACSMWVNDPCTLGCFKNTLFWRHFFKAFLWRIDSMGKYFTWMDWRATALN